MYRYVPRRPRKVNPGFSTARRPVRSAHLPRGTDPPAEQRERNLQRIVNNARFLILPWVESRNLASKVLSMEARRLAADWQLAYSCRPVLLETFVQEDRIAGTCYKAANWTHLGDTQGRGKLDVKHRDAVPVRAVFVYALVPESKNQLVQ